jgi:2',3'-cyclic-nucleotide 2'-phosphodiesterase (5'-nucleotidase family)
VDSGDLLNEEEEVTESVEQAAKLKAELIAKIYNKIGVDAINVGELDLALGINFLKDLAKKQNFPLISANLVDSNNAPIFKPYIVKKVNGKNVGIFGVIGDTSEMTAKVNDITKGAASVQDPLKAAESIVKELSGKVDYMIALTHQGTNRDWVIARRVTGIDLVVGGHDKQKTKDPNEADKTLIVQAGEKNQYQGMLEVTLDGTRKWQNSLVPYGDEAPSDASVKAMISAYNDQLASLYSSSDSKPAAAQVSLRLTACETCHADQVKKWQATDHAKAYETLVKKSKQFDPNCIRCHTTRYNQPEGFSMKLQQPELVNVQCESCHGFAKEHLSDMKEIPTRKPAVSLCVTCHTPDRCPTFEKDYQKVWEKIKH